MSFYKCMFSGREGLLNGLRLYEFGDKLLEKVNSCHVNLTLFGVHADVVKEMNKVKLG